VSHVVTGILKQPALLFIRKEIKMANHISKSTGGRVIQLKVGDVVRLRGHSSKLTIIEMDYYKNKRLPDEAVILARKK
jgi:hypothetical protein